MKYIKLLAAGNPSKGLLPHFDSDIDQGSLYLSVV
jgi:hypothetical protein